MKHKSSLRVNKSSISQSNDILIKFLELSIKQERHYNYIMSSLKKIPSIQALFRNKHKAQPSVIINNHYSSTQGSPIARARRNGKLILSPKKDHNREDPKGENIIISNKSIQEILKFLSNKIELKYISENTSFVKYGDNLSEHLYIILKGEAAILSTIMKLSLMNEEELLLYMLFLRRNNEINLLQLVYYENYKKLKNQCEDSFIVKIYPIKFSKENNKSYYNSKITGVLNNKPNVMSIPVGGKKYSIFAANPNSNTNNFLETSEEFKKIFDRWLFNIGFHLQNELIILKNYFNDILVSRNSSDINIISEDNLLSLHLSLGGQRDIRQKIFEHNLELLKVKNGEYEENNLSYYDMKLLSILDDSCFKFNPANDMNLNGSNRIKKQILKDYIKLKFELLFPEDETDKISVKVEEYIEELNRFDIERPYENNIYFDDQQQNTIKQSPEHDKEKYKKFQSPAPTMKHNRNKDFIEKPTFQMNLIHLNTTEKQAKNNRNRTLFNQQTEEIITQSMGEIYYTDLFSTKNIEDDMNHMQISIENLLMNDENFHLINRFDNRVNSNGIFSRRLNSHRLNQIKTKSRLIINPIEFLDYNDINLSNLLNLNAQSNNNITSFDHKRKRESISPFKHKGNILSAQSIYNYDSNSKSIYKIFTYQYLTHKIVNDRLGYMNTSYLDSQCYSEYFIHFSSETILAKINKKEYFDYYNYLTSKLNVNDIKHVIKCPLFHGFNPDIFQKRYFKLFNSEVLLKNDTLSDKDVKSYIIKNGNLSIIYKGTLRKLLKLKKDVNRKYILGIDSYENNELLSELDKPITYNIMNIDCNFSFITLDKIELDDGEKMLLDLVVDSNIDCYTITSKELDFIFENEVDLRKKYNTILNDFNSILMICLNNLKKFLLAKLYSEKEYLEAFNEILIEKRSELLNLNKSNNIFYNVNYLITPVNDILNDKKYTDEVNHWTDYNQIKSKRDVKCNLANVSMYKKHQIINNYEKSNGVIIKATDIKEEDKNIAIYNYRPKPIPMTNLLIPSINIKEVKEHSTKLDNMSINKSKTVKLDYKNIENSIKKEIDYLYSANIMKNKELIKSVRDISSQLAMTTEPSKIKLLHNSWKNRFLDDNDSIISFMNTTKNKNNKFIDEVLITEANNINLSNNTEHLEHIKPTNIKQLTASKFKPTKLDNINNLNHFTKGAPTKKDKNNISQWMSLYNTSFKSENTKSIEYVSFNHNKQNKILSSTKSVADIKNNIASFNSFLRNVNKSNLVVLKNKKYSHIETLLNVKSNESKSLIRKKKMNKIMNLILKD